MMKRPIVTLILTLALAAANAAPLSALVTCSMTGARGGCSCAHDTCCPDDDPAGPALGAGCCTVTLAETATVDQAPAPTFSTEIAMVPVAAVVATDAEPPSAAERPAPPATISPPLEAPTYCLNCAYLI